MIHLVLAAIEISNSNLDGMESSFHSSRNGMTPFHSGRNGMSSPFRPEWNGHSIPDRMEWLHSIPTGLKWALHFNQIGHSNLGGFECHSFDNLKKYASWTVPFIFYRVEFGCVVISSSNPKRFSLVIQKRRAIKG